MKALCLIQPWATLMSIDAKRIETRSYRTGYRGDLAIHAGKTPADPAFIKNTPFMQSALDSVPMFYGAIVAVVELFDVSETESLFRLISAHEYAFGDYSKNRFGWLTRNVRKLRQPVYTRGFQSVWTLPSNIEAAVRAQIVDSRCPVCNGKGTITRLEKRDYESVPCPACAPAPKPL